MQNTFGSGGPAVAMRVAGDRAAFYGCRFVSFQDTLLDDTGRHYYRGCYVQGGTDFIFGNGKALFDVGVPVDQHPILFYSYVLCIIRKCR